MVDVSLRGARIRARHDDAFSVGAFVDIIVGRGRGVAEITRIECSNGQPFAYYGVQFCELDARLKDLVLDLTRLAREFN